MKTCSKILLKFCMVMILISKLEPMVGKEMGRVLLDMIEVSILRLKKIFFQRSILIVILRVLPGFLCKYYNIFYVREYLVQCALSANCLL